MTTEEIKKILDQHSLWMSGMGGDRANLREAYLSGADLSRANLREAYLRGADLSRADLSRADLSRANLREAYLSGADLSRANLREAYLRGAYLRGADLSRADLSGANISGADLSGARYSDIIISKTTVFTGLYKYIAMPIIAKDGSRYIRLGCHFRSVEDWERDFWNNHGEFPNNGDRSSKDRWFAYQTCLRWFEMMEEEK